jgi:hypothetical protein
VKLSSRTAPRCWRSVVVLGSMCGVASSHGVAGTAAAAGMARLAGLASCRWRISAASLRSLAARLLDSRASALAAQLGCRAIVDRCRTCEFCGSVRNVSRRNCETRTIKYVSSLTDSAWSHR